MKALHALCARCSPPATHDEETATIDGIRLVAFIDDTDPATLWIDGGGWLLCIQHGWIIDPGWVEHREGNYKL